MGLRADPPDFITGDTYDLWNVASWGEKAIETLLGVVVIGIPLLLGWMIARGGADTVGEATGVGRPSEGGGAQTPDVTLH